MILNKWDAVEKDEKTHDKSVTFIRDSLPAISWAPVIITSALTGKRLSRIFDAVDEAVSQHRSRIKTSVLNDVLREAVLWQPPPARKGTGGISGRIYYCSQVPFCPLGCNIFRYFLSYNHPYPAIHILFPVILLFSGRIRKFVFVFGNVTIFPQVQSRPPTIAVFCNNPKYFSDNYRRCLDRKFREQLGFIGTPLRFLWRGKSLRRVEQDTGKVVDRGRGGGREHGYPKPHAR